MARHYKKGRVSHKNLTWRDRYNIYIRDFDKQAQKMEKAGLKMKKEDKLSYNEYIEAWKDKKAELKEEIKQGKRTSVGNVNQFLVREQAYSFSMKVGGGVIPYLVEAGDIEEPTTLLEKARLIMKIRQGEFLESQGFWNAVKDRREELYKEYGKWGHKEANEQISREFFGSK